jgi:hypothetical protein
MQNTAIFLRNRIVEGVLGINVGKLDIIVGIFIDDYPIKNVIILIKEYANFLLYIYAVLDERIDGN